MCVSELQTRMGVEGPALSQQLAVLRRAGLVTTRKQGNNIFYSVGSPEVAELLKVARRFLTARLNEQVDLLRDLAADECSPLRGGCVAGPLADGGNVGAGSGGWAGRRSPRLRCRNRCGTPRLFRGVVGASSCRCRVVQRLRDGDLRVLLPGV